MNEFLAALAKAYWNLDYYDFLFRTGFQDCEYSLEKFQSFKLGCQKLMEFDTDTLQAIVTLSVKQDAEPREAIRTSQHN
jgi:hypothetical protein